MITGDHKITATAIAKQIGIFEDGDIAMTGRELDAMSEEELDRKITEISVYARFHLRTNPHCGRMAEARIHHGHDRRRSQ